jgi:hypothetical protein
MKTCFGYAFRVTNKVVWVASNYKMLRLNSLAYFYTAQLYTHLQCQ